MVGLSGIHWYKQALFKGNDFRTCRLGLAARGCGGLFCALRAARIKVSRSSTQSWVVDVHHIHTHISSPLFVLERANVLLSICFEPGPLEKPRLAIFRFVEAWNPLA
jgi:hypothetical protein